MQAVAPPAEAIQAAMIATAASCAVGAVIGAVAGTRKVHSMLRTLLLATGACASAAIALGLLIRFQSFPLQRAVDRSPWAITVGCIVAIAVSSLAHLLRNGHSSDHSPH